MKPSNGTYATLHELDTEQHHAEQRQNLRQNQHLTPSTTAMPTSISGFFDQHRQFVGNLLVALQFGVLLLLAVLAAPRVWQGHLPLMSLTLAGLSVLLGVWTLAYNRLGNFNIHPAPKASGELVTGGPYRLIRHPMYSAVLLAAAAMAWLVTPWLGVLAWAALVLVLFTKANLEEHWLREHHPGYAAYCQQCKRFVPWLL
jgi:protein-S-isoprenylcysteine O-methyltransferase Ste14